LFVQERSRSASAGSEGGGIGRAAVRCTYLPLPRTEYDINVAAVNEGIVLSFGDIGDSIGAAASPPGRRKIGVVSATFLIFNRIIGTGIFATPSVILKLTGSVGMSLVVWLLGMIIAMTGMLVYLEFGTAIPRFAAPNNPPPVLNMVSWILKGVLMQKRRGEELPGIRVHETQVPGHRHVCFVRFASRLVCGKQCRVRRVYPSCGGS
jgi:hypothetical protein